jgi:hypothetical protein
MPPSDLLTMLDGESVDQYRARLRAWTDEVHQDESPKVQHAAEWDYLRSSAGIDPA